MNPGILTEGQALKLLSFLVTSARLCIDEPENYGSFRLLDAANRLLAFLVDSEAVQDREFYCQLREEIDNKKLQVLSNEAEYAEFLKDMVREVGRYLKTRSTLGAEGEPG